MSFSLKRKKKKKVKKILKCFILAEKAGSPSYNSRRTRKWSQFAWDTPSGNVLAVIASNYSNCANPNSLAV